MDRAWNNGALLPDGRVIFIGAPLISADKDSVVSSVEGLVRIVDFGGAETKVAQIAAEIDDSDHPMAISPDGSKLLLFIEDNTVRVFDIKAMKDLGSLHDQDGPVGKIHGADWSSDGKRIIVWRTSDTNWRTSTAFALGDSIRFFDASTLKAVAPAVEVSTERWRSPAFKYRAAFSRDYQWMSISDAKGTIEVWQLPELKLVSSFHCGGKPKP